MFTWSHLISCTVSWEWSKSLWNCDLQCCSNLTNFREWWKKVGATQKLQSKIIGIFNYVLQFHKFYVSNNFDPLWIKKCLKEVLQNPGNPGHLPLVRYIGDPWAEGPGYGFRPRVGIRNVIPNGAESPQKATRDDIPDPHEWSKPIFKPSAHG